MQIIIQPWTIHEVIDGIQNFDLNPKYQRLPIWKIGRKALLIDSILRGYDLPKFYVRRLPRNRWEVTDGQQRINTLFDFYEDGFPLAPNTIVDSFDLSRLKYSALPQRFKNHFLSFSLTFSEILRSEQGEVNDLFARLQKGVPLNEVELRHAMFSNFGFAVDEFLNEPALVSFFSTAKISNTRFKRQDYIDHVLALSIFGENRDLKADTLRSLLY